MILRTPHESIYFIKVVEKYIKCSACDLSSELRQHIRKSYLILDSPFQAVSALVPITSPLTTYFPSLFHSNPTNTTNFPNLSLSVCSLYCHELQLTSFKYDNGTRFCQCALKFGKGPMQTPRTKPLFMASMHFEPGKICI